MSKETPQFQSHIPKLDLSEGGEMLTDFSREAQRHLISARNSVLVLESVPTDKEAIENIFKTFHTIKGLADFLELRDICTLTGEAEKLMDAARKGGMACDRDFLALVTTAINMLQQFLELLDEQIAAGGTLKSPYPDASELMTDLNRACQNKGRPAASPVHSPKTLATIQFEPDFSTCTQVEAKIKSGDWGADSGKDILEKLTEEFHKTSAELKLAQGKLQERQRELIRERELALKLTQQAQNEARAKSEYLANMSHEIRTLINAILGFTDLLKESQLNDKQKEHLNTIILSGRMLLEIVNDILDYSKVEAGKLKLEKIPFALDQIVADVFRIIRTRLQGKPIDLYFQFAPEVPLTLTGDPTRFKQIFINLLENAIKFTKEGEIGLVVENDPEQKTVGDEAGLRFAVADTGIGIPDEKRKQIFESFTQAEDSTTRLYGGTGLGLALCKNFVEMMGGRIWVESQIGKGSQFIFSIRIPKAQAPVGRPISPAERPFAGTEVMIVDGHPRSCAALVKICEESGLAMMPTTGSAKQASESLLKYEADGRALPAIIFIDAMLPGQEGYMLAYRIRQQEHYRNIKLVALSSDVKTDGSEQFVEAGFDMFLPRPILADEFQEGLNRLLGSQQTARRALSQEMMGKISCEGIRILVAEDSIPNQELLKAHFEDLGCLCEYADNGKEALEKLGNGEYDICFMDLHMPVMGGIDAAKAIREQLKNKIPIIALTAAEQQEEREHCLSAGMNDYLVKPFDVDQLKEKIIKHTKM